MTYWLAVFAVGVHGWACAAEFRAEAPQPAVAIAREGARLQIGFTGRLQSAENMAGPWTDLNAISPVHVVPEGSQRFYRATESSVKSIFSSRAVLEVTVTGPLQRHFEMAFAGMPDGIFPPIREKPYFDATVNLGGAELPVTLRVRGNSSLQECPFPKLKFKVSRQERAGTPFFDAREIKIGTHCAEGGRGHVGRFRDERAAFREALAYEIMELLGFTGPRVRRARIEYRDTTPPDESEMAGWQVIRHAMIFDDNEVVAERLGGRVLHDDELPALTDAAFNAQLITDLQFLHALLGNWDYNLGQNGQGLWNTEFIELPDQQLLPVAGDFDLASWVTAEVRLSAPREYRPDLAEVERQAHYEIEQIQQRVSAASFAAASGRFLQARDTIEAQITAAELDDAGRANALRHVTAFFDALTAVGR